MKKIGLLCIFVLTLFVQTGYAAGTDFKDMKNHWAKEQVNQAVQKGYFNGFPDGNFKPDEKVTYGMIFTVLDRVAKANIKDYENKNILDDIGEGKRFKETAQETLDIINGDNIKSKISKEFAEGIYSDNVFSEIDSFLKDSNVTYEDFDKIDQKIITLSTNLNDREYMKDKLKADMDTDFYVYLMLGIFRIRYVCALHTYEIQESNADANTKLANYDKLIRALIGGDGNEFKINNVYSHYAATPYRNLLFNHEAKEGTVFIDIGSRKKKIFEVKEFDDNAKRIYVFNLIDRFLDRNISKYKNMSYEKVLKEENINWINISLYNNFNKPIWEENGFYGHSEMKKLYCSKIVTGQKVYFNNKGTKTETFDFNPDAFLTRAEFATIVNKLESYMNK